MDIRNRQAVYGRAGQTLAAAPALRRLVLIHSAVTAGVLLLVTAANFLLDSRIGQTGGLGGMGLRSALETAATVLQLAVNLALPFWNIGYIAAVLHALKGERCEAGDLLLGFRRFGPVLRLTLLKELLMLVLILLVSYPAMMLFFMTPWAKPLMEVMASISVTGQMDEAILVQAADAIMLPMTVIVMGAVMLMAVPVFFRLRFAELALMEAPEQGAIRAMNRSLRLTRGNCGALLKIDLHFWWYYVLEGVVTVIAYADTLLTLAGIPLPGNATALFFVTYVVHLAAQVALYWFAKNRVFVTGAVCCEALSTAPAVERKPNVPWTE